MSIVVTVGGGKGGVGKSIVSANLAIALAQSGRQTVIVDGDLGAPNLHSLLGIEKVHRTIESLFTHDIEDLEQARTKTSLPNLTLIAGSAASPGSANIPFMQKQKLLRHIAKMAADVVIVDVGAGTSFNMLDLFNVADVRVMVTTPQLTALQNAYAFAKSAVFRELRAMAADKAQLELLDDPRLGKEAAKMQQLLAQVRKTAPFFAAALREALDVTPLFVLGNCVLEDKDANVFHAFARMVKDFLSVDCQVLGQLRSSRRVHDSVNKRRPLMLDESNTEFALTFARMADRIMTLDIKALRAARAQAEAKAAQAHEEVAPAPLPADLTAYVRVSERKSVALDATLDGEPVQVRDWSNEGVSIHSSRPLGIGSHALLELADGTSHGVEIRNNPDDALYGARFVVLEKKAAG